MRLEPVCCSVRLQVMGQSATSLQGLLQTLLSNAASVDAATARAAATSAAALGLSDVAHALKTASVAQAVATA